MTATKNKELVSEIQMLRTEVKQLKDMVNMLVDIVVDLDAAGDDFEMDFAASFPGKGGKMSLCM